MIAAKKLMNDFDNSASDIRSPINCMNKVAKRYEYIQGLTLIYCF